MELKVYAKRLLCIVLSTCIVLSGLVFSFNRESANAAVAGTYYYKVTINTSDDCEGWNNNALTLFYKSENGTGTESSTVLFTNSYGYFNTKGTKSITGSCNGFPTKLVFDYSWGGGLTWRSLKCNFTLSVSSTANGNYIDILSSDFDKSSSALSSANGSSSMSVDSSKYPYADLMIESINSLSLTCPKPGGTPSVNTITYSATDQYGVALGSGLCEFSVSASYNNNGISVTDTGGKAVISISNEANIPSGINSQTVTAKCVWGGSKTQSTSKTFTLTDCKLTPTFEYYYSNGEDSSGIKRTVTGTDTYFGSTPTVPSSANVTSYYTATKHYSGGSYTLAPITENTTYIMNYGSSGSHTYTYSPNGDGVNHTAKCNSCAYSKGSTCIFTGTVTTQPRCGVEGVKTYTCTYCKDSYTESVPALEHEYNSVVTAPTCLDDGFTTNTCIHCSDTYVSDTVPALGHDYVPTVTPPTCISEGYTTYKCSRCGDTYVDDYTPVTDHTYRTVVTAPTCTERGYTTHICTNCGVTYVDDYVNALTHTFESVVNPPTCTEDGFTTHTCTRCGYVNIDSKVTALGHDYNATVTPATCTEGGYTTFVCSRCNDTYVSDYTTATGHNYTEITVASTCTERGYINHKCSACGDEYNTNYTEPLGHEITSVVTPSTCLEQGYTTVKCTRCDYAYQTDYKQPLGHSYKGTQVAPTCTERGYVKYDCIRCGDTYNGDYISELGHDERIIVIQPTETTQGYTHHDCLRCDYEYDDNFVPALSESKFTVIFKNYDGTVLDTQTVDYGESAVAPADIPVRASDNTFEYKFFKWDTDFSQVTSDITVTAVFSAKYIDYTISFFNYDGTIISTKSNYHYGDSVTVPNDPTRESDSTGTYRFVGWDKEVALTVVGSASYTAVFERDIKRFTVNFLNDDGTLISSKTYNAGDLITDAPTPVKLSDSVYTYTFAGWSPNLSQVTADTTYTAVYDKTYIDYTVKFLDEDGSELSSGTYHFGDTVTEPETPVKDPDNVYSYEFSGWDKSVVPVSGDEVYTATYEKKYIDYTVKFLDEDGSELSSGTYHFGDTVTEPETPVKDPDNVYSYEFSGWDKVVAPVSGDEVYTATYEKKYIDYTVKFLDEDGTELSSGTYHFGDTVTVPKNPSKEADANYTYTFACWSPEVTQVSGDAVYRAVYTSKVNKADYEKVNNALQRVSSLDESIYTSVSFARVEKAVSEVVYDLSALEQVQVDAMADEINSAVDKLVSTVEYDRVLDMCLAVNNDNGTYTADSYEEFVNAMSSVDTSVSFNTEGATQALVDEATRTLENAYSLLKASYMRIVGANEEVSVGSQVAFVISANTNLTTTSLSADDGGANIAELVFYTVKGERITNSEKVIGTGCSVALVYGGEEVERHPIVVLGDITGDGQVTVADIMKSKSMAVSADGFTEYQILAGKCGTDAVSTEKVTALAQRV